MTIDRRAFVLGLVSLPVLTTACTPAESSPWSFLEGGQFTGTVLVFDGTKMLLHKGFGLADRARKVANSPETKFCIASLGKMFTSVAIAQLRLSFQDSASRYVPGLPAEITLHHLLTHTSGLAEVGLGPVLPTVAEVVRQPLADQPGTRFSYSNSGFIVLGAVVERVSGGDYASYVASHIFQPAGMNDTALRAYKPREVPGMALGYLSDGTDNGDRVQAANPSGGAYSTAADLLAFAQALMSHKVLSPELTDLVTTGKVDAARAGGPAVDKYGYGFSDVSQGGVRIIGHNGGTPGYEAQLDIYPARGQVMVALSNQDRGVLPIMRKAQETVASLR